jgi:hypothetical protein
MAETFELVGKVVGLEQKKYRDGRGPIPGFWTVKLQTEAGERSCSFNSDVRKNPRNPNSDREPHPDFPLIQRAQASGESIRIRGHITYKGEGENRWEFKNGTTAEPLSSAASSEVQTPGSSEATSSHLDEAKWAVENILAHSDFEGTLDDQEMARVREGARDLIETTHEVAAELEKPGEDSDGTVADRDELQEKRRRKGIA